ncbi:hypothetical protein ACJZ2D_006375 [Fusarium nematophilum]
MAATALQEEEDTPSIAQTSDETLSDLRQISIRCRLLLHKLSTPPDSPTDGAEAREQMASFNIWASNMGVFREGRQSLSSRLKSAPEISELAQQLLLTLERDLEKQVLRRDQPEQDKASSDTESEDSSDRSSTSSYRLLQPTEDDEAPTAPQSSAWTSIQNTITSLRQLALTVHRAGAHHRQARIERFKNLDRNKEVYETVERYALQKVDHLFPDASETLRKRMAQSIATRRARFSYLETHQKKVSTLSEPAPVLQPKESVIDEMPQVASPAGQPQARNTAAPQPWYLEANMDPSVVLSNTVVTKLDPRRMQALPPKRAESVLSIQIGTGTFPSIPKLDSTGTSFTCPYCFLVCPAKEVSSQTQWKNHLIHDFEPFFCVFDDCSSPFSCAETYTGWITHMREVHTQPQWHCWHCTPPSPSPFSTQQGLEHHLADCHEQEVSEALRPTLLKHSMVRDQLALRHCPFCGGFPLEIEEKHTDRTSNQAHEALEKHVRDHLVSVALILAPVETGEADQELDDTKSEAQRDQNSERDIEEVGVSHPIHCTKAICDCSDKNKDSVSKWSTFEATLAPWGDALGHGVAPGKHPLIPKLRALGNREAKPESRRSKEFADILDWLTAGISRALYQNDECLSQATPDTGYWLLQSDKFQQWVQEKGTYLFCPGIPGAGKTVMTAMVVHELAARFQNDESIAIASVFCSSNSDLQGLTLVDDLLVHILLQLAQRLSSVPACLLSLYHDHKEGQIPPQIEDVRETLRSMTALFSKAFIFVDAIDECQAADELLYELEYIAGEPGTKLFITSRFVPAIQKRLIGPLRQEIEIRANFNDVVRCVDARLAEADHLSPQLQSEIKTRVLTHFDGMFFFVRAFLNAVLEEVTVEDLRSRLRDAAETACDSLYSGIIHDVQELSGHKKDSVLRILTWLTLTTEPLTAVQLEYVLVAHSDPGLEVLSVQSVLDLCHGLIQETESSPHIFRFCHATARSYFQRNRQQWLPDGQMNIARLCLECLSVGACGTGPCLTDEEFDQRLDQYPLYSYAARNWGHHARHAPSLQLDVLRFLQNKAFVESSIQALFVSEPRGEKGLSQIFPRQMTALHLAALFGIVNAMDALPRINPDIDAQDTFGRTPLFYAAMNGHEDAIRWLMTNKSDPNVKDKDGKTPLSEAWDKGHEAVLEILQEFNVDDFQLGHSWLHDLVDDGNWSRAAEVCERVLRSSKEWAYWVTKFLTNHQLDEIVDYVPPYGSVQPRLAYGIYDDILSYYWTRDKAQFEELSARWGITSADMPVFPDSTPIQSGRNPRLQTPPSNATHGEQRGNWESSTGKKTVNLRFRCPVLAHTTKSRDEKNPDNLRCYDGITKRQQDLEFRSRYEPYSNIDSVKWRNAEDLAVMKEEHGDCDEKTWEDEDVNEPALLSEEQTLAWANWENVEVWKAMDSKKMPILLRNREAWKIVYNCLYPGEDHPEMQVAEE